jgi:hypothetical protein
LSRKIVDETQLLDLKRSLTPGLLATPGVSGVGVGDGVLHVYLGTDDPQLRGHVKDLVRAKEPSANVEFIISGDFRASG